MAADGFAPSAGLEDTAPAKINLTLRVTGRRADGYHELCSVVCFANVGDVLRLSGGPRLDLTVEGETAAQSGAISDNLVLKAARALQDQIPDLRVGHFQLTKRLPVAAGLGGGSADAAAALRLLTRLNELAPVDWRLMHAAQATGADVPVCLDPRPRIMRGIGDVLSGPLALPRLDAVLVNPRVAAPTAQVFKALREMSEGDDPAARFLESNDAPEAGALIEALLQSRNDLEAPALSLFPTIASVLAALRSTGGCRLARMSGSGATCFGLFESAEAANASFKEIAERHPAWWVKCTTLGGPSVA
ncbi:MAG: 4-(cytidine 5'-diphospho)-2-C-methyl-D-erythritol kinase [Pseudorhodoplanes sp.]